MGGMGGSHSDGEQDWGGPSLYQFPRFALNWSLRWQLRNLALLPCWPKSFTDSFISCTAGD
jgi:hypothetical protein